MRSPTSLRACPQEHQRCIAACAALNDDVAQLRSRLLLENPRAMEGLTLSYPTCPSVASLRNKAAELEATMLETERSALQQASGCGWSVGWAAALGLRVSGMGDCWNRGFSLEWGFAGLFFCPRASLGRSALL